MRFISALSFDPSLIRGWIDLMVLLQPSFSFGGKLNPVRQQRENEDGPC
jgi:hypothetical protein